MASSVGLGSVRNWRQVDCYLRQPWVNSATRALSAKNLPMIPEPTREVKDRNVTVTLLFRLRPIGYEVIKIRCLTVNGMTPADRKESLPSSPGQQLIGKVSRGRGKNPGAFSPESFLPVPLRRLPGLPGRLAVLAAGRLRGRPCLVSILCRTLRGTGAGSPGISGAGTISRFKDVRRENGSSSLRMAAT